MAQQYNRPRTQSARTERRMKGKKKKRERREKEEEEKKKTTFEKQKNFTRISLLSHSFLFFYFPTTGGDKGETTRFYIVSRVLHWRARVNLSSGGHPPWLDGSMRDDEIERRRSDGDRRGRSKGEPKRACRTSPAK